MRDADPRRIAARRQASGGISSCCRSRRPRRVAAGRVDAAGGRRRLGTDARRSTGCWSRTTRATRPCRSRTGAAAIAAARAIDFGVPALACASTGNLAGATAAAAAAVGLPAYVFIPADLEPAKVDHALAYGATVVPIDGTYDDVNRLCLEIADETGWGFVNINLRPFYAEGSKTLAYEIAESLGWRSPDVVVAPVASGAMFTRVARGFEELAELGLIERRPIRFVGGQAAGCAPVATAFERGHGRHRTGPRARHDRPLAGHRQPGRRALRGRARAGERRVHRGDPDDDTAAAIRDVARLEGIYPETAGGVTLGGGRGGPAARRHPRGRRGRGAADRQRPQDAGRPDARRG